MISSHPQVISSNSLFQIFCIAQLMLSLTTPPPPPEWSPRPNFHKWSQSLVPGEHGGVLVNAKAPHFWSATEAKKLRHRCFFFQICSDVIDDKFYADRNWCYKRTMKGHMLTAYLRVPCALRSQSSTCIALGSEYITY